MKNPRSKSSGGFLLPLEFGRLQTQTTQDFMDSPAPSHLPPERIYWWARQHALILLIGVSAAWLERSGLLLAAMAGASFLAVFRMPSSTEAAQDINLWRKVLLFTRIIIALGVIAEPQTNPKAIVTTLVILTIFQVIEAWLSRKRKDTSPRLALIEQETDALWLISLTFTLVPLTPLGHHIIWLALLRPLAVMTSHWSGAPSSAMPWSSSVRITSCVSLVALSAPLVDRIPIDFAQGLLALGAIGWMAPLAVWAAQATKARGERLKRL